MPSTGDPGRDNADRGPITIIVPSVMTALALLFVLARLTSRRISGRKLAIDDYIVILSIVRAHVPAAAPLLGNTHIVAKTVI